ncbi:MAG: hypothetical protein OHK0019_34020 [Saprospiraceae bacterium]
MRCDHFSNNEKHITANDAARRPNLPFWPKANAQEHRELAVGQADAVADLRTHEGANANFCHGKLAKTFGQNGGGAVSGWNARNRACS